MVSAVLADIVGSRTLPDRSAGQRTLDDVIARVDTEGPAPALRRLTPTVGDEQQGLYATPVDALTALLLIQLALPDEVECRFGIGVGEVATVDSVVGPLAEGPGWWAAREAIDHVHDKEKRALPRARTWIVGAPGQDETTSATIRMLNAYLLVRDHLVGGLTERERRLVYGRIIGMPQSALSSTEGISQPSVSKALRGAGASALIDGLELLRGAS
jgi:hypothetical protein